MELLLIKSHRYVSGYIPGSNLGMNILTQLLRQKGYQAEMFQGYAKEALDYVVALMETAEKPKIIGFYCDFNNIHWIKTFAQEVKKRYPEVILLAGGPQTAGMDAEFLRDTAIAAACIGEGEETILELMDYFIGRKGSLEAIQGIVFLDETGALVENEPRKPPEELDAIPWPDITLTNDYKHFGLLPILTGRGCPFGCTFCYEGANAKRVRRHSVPSLMDEIRANFKRNPAINYINFLDDTFTLDHKRVDQICDEISEIRTDYDFVWFASAHISTIDKHREMAKHLADAGLVKIFFGLESGSDQVLKSYNKKITRKMAVDVINHCVESGIHGISGNIILGGPHETRETIAESESLIMELLYNAPGQFETAYFSFLPYPKTPITLHPEKFGMAIYENLIDCCNEDIPLSRTETLDFTDLTNIRLQANKRLQNEMRKIYFDGKIPEAVILDSYRLGRQYGVFTRWNDYVYKNIPIDDAYWKMRASEEYLLHAQLGKNDEEAIVHRTFELWLYTDISGEKPQIFNQVLDEIDYTLLKLCNGKLSKKEVLRQGRMKLDPQQKNADFYNQAERSLNKMEGHKWILYRKP
ncbi:B12-binding domain-containing radical SAM protein [Acetobacterium wieringae]|uniref:B12-binding domain-containing radical SAM protein n=1 Tax=Acetobacterium wieringae TaxID=52694 RepID=UPI002B211C57|nr:radical SAM protein [Acetobacterium wieringae]MEA4807419.1 radical SAM protein [Acetobacterium wieringae]